MEGIFFIVGRFIFKLVYKKKKWPKALFSARIALHGEGPYIHYPIAEAYITMAILDHTANTIEVAHTTLTKLVNLTDAKRRTMGETWFRDEIEEQGTKDTIKKKVSGKKRK